MKKVFSLIKGTFSVVSGNLSYILTFAAGSWFYATYPTLALDIKMGLVSAWDAIAAFDYVGAWESSKAFAIESYNALIAKFASDATIATEAVN